MLDASYFDESGLKPNYTLSGETETKINNNHIYNKYMIAVYAANGNLIRRYSGTYTILEYSAHKIVFEDVNKKKCTVIIPNGVITIEEL